MNFMSEATAIFKKISNLEQEIQKLKLQAYFDLPKKKRLNSLYSQESVVKAVRSVRNKIWQEKYAKKAQGIS